MTVAPDVNVVQPNDEDFWQSVVSRGDVTNLPRWPRTPVENIGVFDPSPDNAATSRCCLEQSCAMGHITVHDDAGEVIRLSDPLVLHISLRHLTPTTLSSPSAWGHSIWPSASTSTTRSPTPKNCTSSTTSSTS